MFSILFVVCCVGCSHNEKEDTNATIIDIDKFNNTDTINFSQIFNSYKVIPLETNDSCLIGSVSSIRFCNDYIVVLDQNVSQSVFLFDINGNFIRKIGAMGKGPGEYIIPYSITTNEDDNEIMILDDASQRILIFSLNGEFIRNIPYKASCKSIEYYNGKLHSAKDLCISSDYALTQINNEGNITNEWIPLKSKLNLLQGWSPYTNFFRTPSGLRFRVWYLNDIYSINSNSINTLISLKSNSQCVIDEMDKLFTTNNQFSIESLVITSYVEMNNLSIIEYLNLGEYFLMFYNQKDGTVKSVKFRNFKDDITHNRGMKSGHFYTSYKDYLVSEINSNDRLLWSDLIDNIELGKVELNSNKSIKLTNESNPVIIMYKCKEAPSF